MVMLLAMLAVLLLGIGIGVPIGVAIAVRERRLDEHFHEELDLQYKRLLEEEL